MNKNKFNKCFVIYNPTASGFKEKNISLIMDEIKHKTGIVPSALKSNKKRNVIDLVKSIDSKDSLIITLGGDGTVSEAYEAYLKNGQKGIYAHIPTGTTNDMAKNYNVRSDNPNEIVRDILDGEVSLFDTYSVNGQSVAYSSVFGYLAHVPYVTNNKLKKHLGHAAYVVSAGKYLMKKPIKYDISYETDNIKGQGEFILGAVSNSNGFAGIDLFPKAKLNDGKVELLLIKDLNTKLILDIAKDYFKNDLDLKKYKDHIIMDQASNIKLKFNDRLLDFPVDVDGENSYILPNYVDDSLTFKVEDPIKVMKNKD